jgi:hypothetical protein
MSAFDDFQYFVKYILPIGILTFGLIGNTLGIIVLFDKDMKNIGPKRTYIYLFLSDSFFLLQIIVHYFQLAHNLYIATLSDVSCKLWFYFNYSFGTVSSYLIVYISLERCISITRPAWKFFLRKNKIQLIWFILVTFACMLYYLPAGLYYTIKLSDDETTNCVFSDENAQMLISYMDLAIRAILPFFIMIFCSVTLIYSLFKSRQRVVENFLTEENQTIHRELRLAVSSISLNIIYIATQLPLSITMFETNFSDFYYEFTYYIFYLSFAINFYIILATNSLFRSTFFSLFRYESPLIIPPIKIYPQIDNSRK